MFTDEELKIIENVLSRLTFRPGQRDQIIAVENIIKKIQENSKKK